GGGCSGSGSCGSSLTPGSSTLFEYTPDRQRVSRTPSGYVGTSAPSPSLANHGGDTTQKSRQVCHVSEGDTPYTLGGPAGTWHPGASWTFLGYDPTGKARWDGPRNWHWAFEHNDSCSPPAGGLPTATPFGGPIGGLPTATPGGIMPTPCSGAACGQPDP